MRDYNDLPPSARLWIYPSSRVLAKAEVEALNDSLSAFAKTWTSHSRDLTAFAGMLHNRFLVIAVDEAAAVASGCSIDASVRIIRELGERHNIDFFDRMTFFVEADGELTSYSRENFEAAYRSGKLNAASRVVDPLVTTKAAADASFIKLLADSWHARFV